jgi:hypothetical protein
MDLVKMIKLVIKSRKYHIIVTHIEDEEIVSDCFMEGIDLCDVIKNLKKISRT